MNGFSRRMRLNDFILMILDAIFIVISGGLAFIVRFDFRYSHIPVAYINAWIRFLPIQIVVTVLIFVACRMYHYVWHSVSARDALFMFLTVTLAAVLMQVLRKFVGTDYPQSVIFIEYVFELITLVGMRCFFRFVEAGKAFFRGIRAGKTEEHVMLIGAGEAGRVLVREMVTSSHITTKPVCFIDDNKVKWGKYLEGVPIVGGRDKIQSEVEKRGVTQIFFTIPTATPEEKKEILEICRTTGCELKILPGMYQLVNGEVSMAALRPVEIEDLLGREPVKLNLDVLNDFISGKTVLVTGGGGSIGSELCRQVAKYNPRRLIILDIYENNAYDIQQELKRLYEKKLNLFVEIASVRDKEKMFELFGKYSPDLVFHAAAHKHVPLMEDCPSEAIKNNILGTYNVVRASEKYGVRKFVMISTDKAVNPTNVMGASKRFCEMIIQSRSSDITEFCSVRFGNVLGSNGSVVPLFKKQIREGGPVTLTDKRITRFFMTIPEAASLVLEAGAKARKNQIFVLDMGEPVKILDLAENLIRLSGLEPYKDIQIEEIGLRPGEKLYEELLMKSDTLQKTDNNKIFVEKNDEIDASVIREQIISFRKAIKDELSNEELIAMLHDYVPTYHTPDEVNSKVFES